MLPMMGNEGPPVPPMAEEERGGEIANCAAADCQNNQNGACTLASVGITEQAKCDSYDNGQGGPKPPMGPPPPPPAFLGGR